VSRVAGDPLTRLGRAPSLYRDGSITETAHKVAAPVARGPTIMLKKVYGRCSKEGRYGYSSQGEKT
jgi:hypothetical protein